MIVPMAKVTVFTTRADQRRSLKLLRDIGVLHVSTGVCDTEEMAALLDERERLTRAMTALEQGGEAPKEEGPAGDAEADTIVEEILSFEESIENARGDIDRVEREIARLEPWGDFSPLKLAELEPAGVRLRLYQVSPDRAGELESLRTIEIERTKSVVRVCAVLFPDDSEPETLEAFPIPDESLSQLLERRTRTERVIEEAKSGIAARKAHLPLLRDRTALIDEQIEFTAVDNELEGDETIAWISGFAPQAESDRLRNSADENGWGIVLRKPSEGDNVPTKVQNPRPIGIIQPVFDMLGTVPGYRELDISFFFLLFFTLFFAMIIGDGGYGVILLALGLWATAKSRKKGGPGPGIVLLLVLSVATVVWGALTGNWFGYEGFARLPFLRDLVIPGIYTHSAVSPKNIQFFCFVIGTVHLSIARGWGVLRNLRQAPRLRALSELGMLSMVLGLYYLVLQLVLDPTLYPMPGYAVYMIGGGFISVLLFSNQEAGQNVFIGALKGLGGIITIALDSISAFSDIISYIRLYAVGLASFAIAQSFNDMAAGIGAGGGIGSAVAAAVVLLLGHTLNLAMGALSVVVHGVRLNMLEFSGHLGMEWTGEAYAPFRKEQTA